MREYSTFGVMNTAEMNEVKILPLVVRVTVDKRGATLSIADEENTGIQFTIDIDQILHDIRKEKTL